VQVADAPERACRGGILAIEQPGRHSERAGSGDILGLVIDEGAGLGR